MSKYLPFLTASATDSFLACSGSAVLPRTITDISDAAQAGTDEHLERLQVGMLPQKVLDWFGGVDPVYEAAMAADADDSGDAKYLGQYLARGYPLLPGPYWITGTADMVKIDGYVLSVGDLKTGRGQSRGALKPPAESGQLRSLAWLMLMLRQLRDPTWRPTRIRLMWWLTSERVDDIDDAEITYDDLMAWSSMLRQRILSAKTSALRLKRGPQCSNCAAFDACPAQAGAVRRVLDFSGRAQQNRTLSDEAWAAAWQDLQAAKRILETAQIVLTDRVINSGSVPVDDSHELRLVRTGQTLVDAGVAADVLGDRFLDCVTTKVTKESICRGLGTRDVGSVLDEIGKRGGLTKVSSSPYLRVVRK